MNLINFELFLRKIRINSRGNSIFNGEKMVNAILDCMLFRFGCFLHNEHVDLGYVHLSGLHTITHMV